MSVAKYCPHAKEFCKMEKIVEDSNPPKDIAKYLIERLEKAGILPKIVLPEGSDKHIDEIIEQTIDLIDRY